MVSRRGRRPAVSPRQSGWITGGAPPLAPWLCTILLVVFVGSALAQSAPGVVVAGVVKDETGAVLQGAVVELMTTGAKMMQSTVTDGTGQFHFGAVPVGTYDLRAHTDGFRTVSHRVRVGTRPPAPLDLSLALAALEQDITVSSAATQVDTAPANDSSTVTVDQTMLEGLPILDQDYIGTISRFLDAGSLGTGGVTLIVNGMEVSSLRVSASAVQQIKINQDPYSAEYSRPGRGRIEILTKPGGQTYHGEGNFVFRDARLDATNAFAQEKPAEQKHIVEGVFGGPIGQGGATSFLFSGNDQVDDQQAIVFAVGPDGQIRDLVPQPNSQALFSGSLTHQVSPRTTISITPSYEYESAENRGVGGVTLATAGTTFKHHEQQVTYVQQTLIRPSLLNQFQILVGHEREPTTSVSPDVGIVVVDAFTGGGGQGDLLRTETHAQLTESLVWTKGRHQVQAGFQVPDWSRRGFFDRTNVGGTFYFSGLDTYGGGRPYAFIQQRGNGDLVFIEKQLGAYIKDDWQVGPGFSASFGLRYDWQNYFHDDNNLAPRLSLAFSPGQKKATVIRVGVGLFTDRSGPVAIADLLHAQPGGLVRYVISNPSYPDALGSPDAAPVPSTVRLAPDVQIPQTLQYSVSVDRQLAKTTTLSVAYTGARGYHLFRSRDINAPEPPFYLARPDPANGVIREIESNGHQSTDSVQVTLRGRVTRWFTGQSQYTLSRAWNDTNGIASYAANDYDLTGEWARADFDRRHRFLLLGRLSAGRRLDVGVSVTMNSAGPYTETLGDDIFNNGRGHARPLGVPRNSLVAAPYAQLDVRLSHEFKVGAPKAKNTFAVALDVFNVLNRVNDGAFVGTIGSPLFGQPVSARPPRQVQLSAKVEF